MGWVEVLIAGILALATLTAAILVVRARKEHPKWRFLVRLLEAVEDPTDSRFR